MRIDRWLLAICLCGLLNGNSHAQTLALHADGPLPSFEVATIKPNDASVRVAVYAPGVKDETYFIGNMHNTIARAYQVGSMKGDRVVGVPDWADKQIYRIQAKISEDIFAQMQKMTPEEKGKEQNLMLQSLLQDRMKLKVHIEQREFPVYELVVAKDGPKLTKAKDETLPGGAGMVLLNDGVRFRARSATMADLASGLQMATADRKVVDRTGIDGKYDIELKFSPEGTGFAANPQAAPASDTADAAPSVFTAIQDLGLKLVPGKAMFDVVVIDHIEQPTEN